MTCTNSAFISFHRGTAVLHGLLLLLAACYSGTANAQTPGTQDSAYEVLAPEGESWAMLATQVDGKVLAVSNAHSDSPGHLIVYRFNHDGEPDSSFSGDGKATVDARVGRMATGKILVDPAGKIYVAGGGVAGRVGPGSVEETAYSGWYAIARLLPDGAVDSSFGSGGLVRYTFATDDAVPDAADAAVIADIALQPDGKLLLMGQSVWNQITRLAEYPLVFARLHANGRLDTGFGDNGIVKTSVATAFFAYQMKVMNDGSIIVEGGEPGVGPLIVKLDARLALDSSFGSGGKVQMNFNDSYGYQVWEMTPQPDGKIVVAGARYMAESEPMVFRLTADGAFDPDFGAGGFSFPAVNANSAYAKHLALQPDGRILVAGMIDEDTNAMLAREPFLLRLLENGQVDGGFLQSDIAGSLQGGSDLVVAQGAYLLAFDTIDPIISSIKKFHIDPVPRSGSLSTGQTPSLSGFHIDVRNTSGTVVDSATTAHVLGVNGYIFPQSADVNVHADIFVAAASPRGWFMLEEGGRFVPWNTRIADLVPAYKDIQLNDTTHVPVYAGRLPFAGPWHLYMGYMRSDGGPLIYLDEPASVQIAQ